ncbi:anti-sigma factor [Bacillus albus]|uniref:anti-sigma factor n=1 Tax=Bacillus albus TaxID=2026189 RepID=UPI003D2611C6
MEEKVEELIDICKQQIYSLCYKLAETKEDAEDIFQETWILLLTIIVEQFVAHLDNKKPIIIALVIVIHLYIPIYIVIQSFLKKEYKLHDRVR